MKLSVGLILFLFSGFLSYSQKYTVQVVVTYIQPYCGGARPSEEILEMARTPLPYVEKKVIAVNEKGKAFKLKTNKEGKIVCKLKEGNYKLFEEWRFNKNTPDGQPHKNYDANCLKAEWLKEFAVLTVESKKLDYRETNGIVNTCNYNIPCVLDSFRGPIPE
jgi:hypothetical protein